MTDRMSDYDLCELSDDLRGYEYRDLNNGEWHWRQTRGGVQIENSQERVESEVTGHYGMAHGRLLVLALNHMASLVAEVRELRDTRASVVANTAIPKGLCGVSGCVYTPHDDTPHSWESLSEEGTA